MTCSGSDRALLSNTCPLCSWGAGQITWKKIVAFVEISPGAAWLALAGRDVDF